jgi:phosphoglycolate phosphatase
MQLVSDTQHTKCSEPPLAVLFDIDGTLIDSNGAGGAALLAALQVEFAVDRPKPVVLHGRTDAGIIAELLANHQIDPNPDNFSRLCERYFALLPAELMRRGGRVLPGVLSILAQLRDLDGCHLGLLTGNLPVSAQLKLQHFGLWHWFEFGIFGDRAAHRPLLAEHAQSEVNRRSGRELPPRRIILVGDTPLDAELAVAMRARCLAVATGGFDQQQLMLAGACRAVADLSHTADIMNWILNQTELG